MISPLSDEIVKIDIVTIEWDAGFKYGLGKPTVDSEGMGLGLFVFYPGVRLPS